jgi:hypothetical protein
MFKPLPASHFLELSCARRFFLSAITGAGLFLASPVHAPVQAQGADEIMLAEEPVLVEQSALLDRCTSLPWAPNVSIRDPLVFTYYYYWYSDESLENPGLAQFPPPVSRSTGGTQHGTGASSRTCKRPAWT